VNFAIRELLNLSIIRAYPPLVDKNKGLVSQAEHSFLITEQGSEILTRFNEF
jgi:methionyl aminopeptidase